jgi:phage gpG-like protein
MAEATLEFDSAAVRAFFERIHKNVKDIEQRDKVFVTSLSAIVYRDVISHFEEQRGSKGKWKKWSAVYEERMRRIGRSNNKILQFDGSLRQAFRPTNWRSRREGIEWFNPAKTKKGFPYALAHDEGGPKLPKRDFMWLSQSAFERIAEITASYMISGRGNR